MALLTLNKQIPVGNSYDTGIALVSFLSTLDTLTLINLINLLLPVLTYTHNFSTGGFTKEGESRQANICLKEQEIHNITCEFNL